MRYGNRYDELDRATDIGRDEFPKTFHEAVDFLSMEGNRLIEQQNRSQNWFNNGGINGCGTNGVVFAQARAGPGGGNDIEQRTQGVRNENGQFFIPAGETPVAGRDRTIVCYQCWTCGRWGHTNCNNNCPNDDGDNVSIRCVNSVTFNNVISDFYLKDTIYLLDSAATNSTVKNKDRLTNLTNCSLKDRLITLTNVGSIKFNLRG